MHGIAPYKFYVLDEQKVPQDLWNLNKKTFKEYLEKNYFPKIKNKTKITQVSSPGVVGKSYIFKKLYKATKTSTSGLFETGEFGYESNLYDTVTKKSTHIRGVNESMMIPFHFSFYTPHTGNIKDHLFGILNLSRFNRFGIRSIIIPDLISDFSKTFPGLELKVEKIVPTSLVQTMLDNKKIKRLKLTISQLPRSIRQALANSGFDNYYEVEMIIKPKPGSFFSTPTWLKNMGSLVPINSIITIPATQISKIKIEIGLRKGKNRTINIYDVTTMASNIEIDNPRILKSNHIDPKCWIEESDNLANDICLESGLIIPEWNSEI